MDIKKFDFEKTDDGRAVTGFELKNSSGTTAKIIPYGARLTSWIFSGVEVVLGYDNIADYQVDASYKNHSHGGFNGFEKKIWLAEITSDGLKLSIESPDSEGGYPSNFKATVIYNLTEDNALEISYSATSDKDTLCNLTNHTYFNLDGGGNILQQKIQIFADSYTWANAESIPDGRILSVENTPMDLRKLQAIGEHIDDAFDQLNFGRGYDHNFCVGKFGEMKKVACAESSDSKIILEVLRQT